jgi:hypothetical protein
MPAWLGFLVRHSTAQCAYGWALPAVSSDVTSVFTLSVRFCDRSIIARSKDLRFKTTLASPAKESWRARIVFGRRLPATALQGGAMSHASRSPMRSGIPPDQKSDEDRLLESLELAEEVEAIASLFGHAAEMNSAPSIRATVRLLRRTANLLKLQISEIMDSI